MPPKLRFGEGLPSKVLQAIAHDVHAACRRRGTAAAKGGGRRALTTPLVEELERRILLAASHASVVVPNKVARAGPPPDNARIILVYDIMRTLNDLGLSDGAHFVPPHQSLAVELYGIVATRVWPYKKGSLLNPRSTFRRMKAANISN